MSSAKSKNLTGSYSCIQALYWMYFAAVMSFSGFFLLGGGFSNTQIGIIAAAAVANFLQWGIAAVNAMVVSAVFFFIGELTGANK